MSLSRPSAPTMRTFDSGTGYLYVTTRYPKSQARYAALRTAVVKALSSELIPSHTGPVSFGDAQNGYAIAYVFAIEDHDARGGRREGRRWYTFLALFEGETEATGAWCWVTSGFEKMANGLKERASSVITAREAARETGTSRAERRSADPDERDGEVVQSRSLEERVPSHIKIPRIRDRASFGHLEGAIHRLRLNPELISTYNEPKMKSLAELVGMDTVDIELHAAMGWIMSGLLGPAKDVRKYAGGLLSG